MKQEKLFKTEMIPGKDGSGKLFEERLVPNINPVSCLGIEFTNDEERRKHFTDKLRVKLQDAEFRKIEGFPIGTDEDILNLSDPPYYTACPNPWIADFIKEWEAQKQTNPARTLSGVEGYHREPFAADVSEGKNDPIYNAHSYHTKVPHKAIMRYILHYTEPGDIVFDGFCGTGMTGVAAQMCGDKSVVMELGYQVKPDGTILQEETDEEGKVTWVPFSKLGVRRAVLNDLSPAATFIAYNYNTPVDVVSFEKEAKRILKEVEEECGWMYETLHVEPASSRLLKSIDFLPCNPFQATETTYRKDNLPHIQVSGATYFITFRTEKFRILTPEARTIALNAIRHWDNQRWKLFSAVVMPDHVHLVARPLLKVVDKCWDLSDILHSVKSFSSNEINKLEGKVGTPVWQSERYDRVVRDEKELVTELAYLNHNPVKAGLCLEAGEYEWRFVAGELEAAGWKPALLGRINYTVWSDVFVCSECSHEVIFWEAAVDKEAKEVKEEFPCTHCSANLTKRNMERSWISKYDSAISTTVRQAKQVPVVINYSVNGIKRRFEKTPDDFDIKLIESINDSKIDYWFPTDLIPEGDKTGEPLRIGFTNAHHFFTKRNLWVLAASWNRAIKIKNRVPFLVTASQRVLSKMASIAFSYYFHGGGGFVNAGTKGTLYISSTNPEVSVLNSLSSRIRSLLFDISASYNSVLIETKSATAQSCAPINSIDYIFIDPPFGANINYSELNLLWEPWLKIKTENCCEAIESKKQGKSSNDYRYLMRDGFQEAFRLLKPGRWMTVEFSNTNAAIWNNIQTAITEAGFIVANVSALDKKQGSFNAYTSPTAVKQDLVISAYKPNGGFEDRFLKEAETEEGVWDFVRTHLKYLPVVKRQGTALQIITERDPRILFDQMVSYYVRKGFPVPISSPEFQTGLAQRFIERDGMFFLPDQVAEYDRKKMMSGEIIQASFFVSDEATAIQWLRYLIKEKPQTFSDINPQFMQQLGGWSKNEAQLDLRELLNQNFLCYEGKSPVPSQIHSYLSSNWPEMRRLEAGSTILIAKACDRWYLPDPNKVGDLEKLREKALFKEFEEYVALASSQRKLKVFRLEAVRVGFKRAWQERDYATIVEVADKIPNAILEEDPKLLMWYDQAVTRLASA